MPKSRPLAERFWEKVDKRGPDECWPWMGGTSHGYGQIGEGAPSRKLLIASRVAYELGKGPIPKGKIIMHSCDFPLCCNPKHLFAGTHKDNSQECNDRGRRPLGETHHSAKLSASDIETIRSAKGPQKEIAARFGVAQGTISNIRRGYQRKSG